MEQFIMKTKVYMGCLLYTSGPSFIERSADIPMAVKHIMDSKTFDNGTICASEQSIVTESVIEDQVVAEVKRQGGYFLDEEQSKKLEKMIMRANNTMNPAIVGKSAVSYTHLDVYKRQQEKEPEHSSIPKIRPVPLQILMWEEVPPTLQCFRVEN